jgi:hypothetical protein
MTTDLAQPVILATLRTRSSPAALLIDGALLVTVR